MRFFFALAALLLASCFAPARAASLASPSVGVSVGQFDPYLDPYGAWLTVPGYGRVWQPAPQYVGSDFYPYGSGGQWVYTNAGWVFDSEYPFGWAVFHYGRWTRHFDYGWLWIPGSQWGASWVSWRFGGPFVGWAPLGPRGALGVGYRDWCFVPSDRFTVRNVRAYSAGEYEFHRAVAVTAPSRVPGPPPELISRATGSRVRQVPVDRLRGGGRIPPPPRGRSNAYGSSPRSAYPQGQLTPAPQQRYRSAPDSNDQRAPPVPTNRYRAQPPAGQFEPMTPAPPPARYRAAPPSPGAAPMTLPPPARAMPRAPSMPSSPPPPAPSMKRTSPPPASPAPRMAPPPPPPRGGRR